MNNFEELMKKTEPLHPELVPWVCKTGIGDALKHPLVFQIFYHPQLNAICNEQYKTKKEYIKKAIEEKNWESFIWMHERPYRLDKFAEISSELEDKEYWKLLGSIWSDSENLWQYGRLIEAFINSKRRHREAMMDKEEKKFLKNLPDQFIIYRGHQGRNRLGYAWTLSYWKAKWFAQRFQHKRQGVIKAIVKKQDVIATLLGRNEFEIIAIPNKLEKIETIKKMKRPGWLEKAKKQFESTYALGVNSSYHGPWHWEKVELNALEITKRTPGADKVVTQLFALIHDSKRENENEDPNHGHRSAEYAENLFNKGQLEITKEQLGILMEACKYHNDGQISDHPTIGSCWDADRLDLTRVGIVPDPKLLSTQAGKELLWRI